MSKDNNNSKTAKLTRRQFQYYSALTTGATALPTIAALQAISITAPHRYTAQIPMTPLICRYLASFSIAPFFLCYPMTMDDALANSNPATHETARFSRIIFPRGQFSDLTNFLVEI